MHGICTLRPVLLFESSGGYRGPCNVPATIDIRVSLFPLASSITSQIAQHPSKNGRRCGSELINQVLLHKIYGMFINSKPFPSHFSILMALRSWLSLALQLTLGPIPSLEKGLILLLGDNSMLGSESPPSMVLHHPYMVRTTFMNQALSPSLRRSFNGGLPCATFDVVEDSAMVAVPRNLMTLYARLSHLVSIRCSYRTKLVCCFDVHRPYQFSVLITSLNSTISLSYSHASFTQTIETYHPTDREDDNHPARRLAIHADAHLLVVSHPFILVSQTPYSDQRQRTPPICQSTQRLPFPK
ncbi:hypothetical protein ACRALDRAFT_205928 [Sodiomyces alcalophilus JCM 7366]|uniref:uncharacterized protein n=1 Tax=Sodiomyces alcalophilus JCM 7366 TaxID=591952 RepID=UPI0039B4CCCF